jgi:hypothetical protein
VDYRVSYDDGREVDVDYTAEGVRSQRSVVDAQDAHAWSSHTTTYAADGVTRVDYRVSYDDGRELDADYTAEGVLSQRTMVDVADVYDWQSYVQTYDAAGKLLETDYTYDPFLG